MDAKNKIWMRLGVEIFVTDEEREELLRNENGTIVKKAIKDGRWELSQDTYIPADTIECINDECGTDFDVRDIGFDF